MQSSPQSKAALHDNVALHSDVTLHIAIAATFTAEPVEKTLSFWLEQFDIPHKIRFSPYNQVFQQLLDPNSIFAQNKNVQNNNLQPQHALNVIYLRLEDWLSSTAISDIISSTNFTESNSAETTRRMLQQNAEDFVNAVKVASLRGPAQHFLVFCPISEASVSNPQYVDILRQTEAHIVHQLRATDHVETITQEQVLDWYPLTQYDDQFTARAGHVPYTDTCYAALASATIRRYSALTRAPHKVIVLDCDNTLWEGVCAEEGPTGVKITDSFSTLQSFMLAQQEAGMLLCLASKNIEADVDAVFEQNDGMLLGKSDIVSARINWQSKSENIKSLAQELNLGLDSFIFIDDNPIECAEVRANCPEVATFQLPQQPKDVERFLHHIWIFDKVNITEEDKKRAERYQQNTQREQAKNSSASLKDFLKNLKLSINISTPTKAHFPRVAQLTQRTNQFNTTTIRRNEADIDRLIRKENLKTAIVQVSDRYGDYGLVGVLLYNIAEEALQVDSLILSCRALGRGVEQAMIRFLAEEASAKNKSQIDIAFTSSERNKPVYSFLESVAPSSKVEYSQGTAYKYNTADLLKLEPMEAATPSTATNSGDVNGSAINGSAINGSATNGSAVNGSINGSTANGKSSNGRNANNGAMKGKQEPAGLQNRPDLLWQSIAGTLHDPVKIKAQVLSRTAPRPSLQTPLIEPQTHDELIVAQIWQDILGINGIGLEDGFKELGGTSLQLVQIYGRLRTQFEVDLPFTTLFGLPTIRAFIEYLGATPDEENKAIAIQQRAARQKAAMQEKKVQERKKLQLNLR